MSNQTAKLVAEEKHQDVPKPATLKEDHHNLDLTPWHDCAGDCLLCMAQAGDPDCISAMRKWLDRMER